MNPRSHHTGSPGKDTADPSPYIPTQVYPSNFIMKLGWERSSNSSRSSRSKLSVTGDTAKYLGFTLCRGLYTLPARLSREDRDETIFRSRTLSPQDGPIPTYTPTSAGHVGTGPYNLLSQDRAHMTCGCTWKLLDEELVQSPLFLGGDPHLHRADAPLIPIRPGGSFIKLFCLKKNIVFFTSSRCIIFNPTTYLLAWLSILTYGGY